MGSSHKATEDENEAADEFCQETQRCCQATLGMAVFLCWPGLDVTGSETKALGFRYSSVGNRLNSNII